MVPYGACFHFIGLFCYGALTVKVEKTYKKMLFTGTCSSYKMPKVKHLFLLRWVSPAKPSCRKGKNFVQALA